MLASSFNSRIAPSVIDSDSLIFPPKPSHLPTANPLFFNPNKIWFFS